MLKNSAVGAGHWTPGGVVDPDEIGLVNLTKVDNVNDLEAFGLLAWLSAP
jgi:hypothetical protein